MSSARDSTKNTKDTKVKTFGKKRNPAFVPFVAFVAFVKHGDG